MPADPISHFENHTITCLLHAYNAGHQEALEQLMPLVYDELCAIASRYLMKERHNHTLDTYALVHEVYARLLSGAAIPWQDRKHFYVVFARAMRRLLCDHARKYKTEKRGGGQINFTVTSFSNLCILAGHDSEDHTDLIFSVNDALLKLEEIDPKFIQLIELRFYYGLTMPEIAKVMDRSVRSIHRDWQVAKAYLQHHLKELDQVKKPWSPNLD